MKLFTTNEVVSNKQKQISLDIKRATAANAILNEKRKELQSVESEFEATISKQQIEWEKEKKEYVVSINSLRDEIKILEERRKQSLTPLDEQRRQIKEALDILSKKESKLKENLEEYEEKVELLEDKLSSVAERELEAGRIINIQKIQQQGIDSQKELVSKQSRDLSLAMFNFKKEAGIRERAIKSVEVEIILKQKAIKDKELDLIKIEKSFIDRERALQDKYATLERAIKEKI
jgi:chromosome segregation ATPase